MLQACGLAALLFALTLLQVASGASPSPVEALASTDITLHVGTPAQHDFTLSPGNTLAIPVTLIVSGTRRLGAASFLLHYDPLVVRPILCTPAGTLEGTPSGVCNLAFDPQAGDIKFNLLSLQGLSGTLPVYTVGFEITPGAMPGARSELTLTVEHAADPAGVPLSWQTENGSLTIATGPSSAAQLSVGAPGEMGTYTLTHGAVVTASIWLSGAHNLGAATLALAYEAALVRPLHCNVRPGAGGLNGGVCALQDGLVRANVLAIQGFSGTARLLDVTFTPIAQAPVGISTPLTLSVESLVDATAKPLPARVRNGSLIIAEGDAPGVALVRVGDAANGGNLQLARNGRVVVPIRVEEAKDLGAATLALDYDPDVVQPLACTPVYTGLGGGACNLSAAPGQVRLNIVSLAGFTGTSDLYAVTFGTSPSAAIGQRTDLTLSVIEFASPLGEVLLYRVDSGSIAITASSDHPAVVLRAGRGNDTVPPAEYVAISVTATVNWQETPPGLGAASLRLHYDPSVARAVTCTLNQTGAASHFDGGACNLDYAEGQVRFNVVSVRGVTGELALAKVVFHAIGQVGAQTPLTLSVDHLADTTAQGLTYRTEPGWLWIMPKAAYQVWLPLVARNWAARAPYQIWLPLVAASP